MLNENNDAKHVDPKLSAVAGSISEPGEAVRFINSLASELRSRSELISCLQQIYRLMDSEACRARQLFEEALLRLPFFYDEAKPPVHVVVKGVYDEEPIRDIQRRSLLVSQSELVQNWYDEFMPITQPVRQNLPLGSILRLAEEADVSKLRLLINAAYSELGEMGLNYTGATQDEETTRRRMRSREVWVIEKNGELKATMALRSPRDEDDLPHAWYISQFGVDPKSRGLGLGGYLILHAFDRSRETGCSRLRLDTAVSAYHLVRLYRRFGFRTVEVEQWRDKTYPSYIMEAETR